MSNFTTLKSTPETLSAAPTEQEVKAEPQIDALASSEAQPANTSPSAGKDGRVRFIAVGDVARTSSLSSFTRGRCTRNDVSSSSPTGRGILS
ncbi:hypothetical protein DAEQUDRAFT_461568 [Daedalea quercina L-15889]|uniref:Uncharacterized protein n=1 Tax=Daedalea quercina L-15889 TaxID=1314783 RepID=A0A165TD42_9APHY|nr:hypothetical protein DAEQUDRAFT_461568 [Daedalea quercina L-15889]